MLSTLHKHDLTRADRTPTIDISTERNTERQPDMLTLREVGLQRTQNAKRTAVLRERAVKQEREIEYLEADLRELRGDLDWTQRELSEIEERESVLAELAESLRD